MQLSRIPAIGSAVEALGALGEAVGHAVTTAPTASPSTPRAISPEERLREIAGQYDFRAITPRQFAEFVERVQKSDLLSNDELQVLSSIRLELDGAGNDPDEPLDLVQYLGKKLSDERAAGQTSDATRRKSEWIEKLWLSTQDGEAKVDLSA